MRYALSESDWQVALARYKAMPPTIKYNILGQELDKRQIISNVEQRTPAGETLVAMQKNYQEWVARR